MQQAGLSSKAVNALGAICIAASASLAAPPCHAKPGVMDEVSVTYGYYKGSIETVCALLDEGFLARSIAQTFIEQVLKPDKDVARIAQMKALHDLLADRSLISCPLPPMPKE